jgi:predicted MPP superfamily phosphohydrolase
MHATASPSFSWLHLSDLHVGMTNQGWMWPTLKTRLFEDLSELHLKSGPWDVVIFSGDLTQKAVPAEFDRFSATLVQLWEHFARLGSTPALFVVPGNHDLARPPPLDPEALILSRWWDNSNVLQDLLDNAKSKYRAAVVKAFRNYDAWLTSLATIAVPLVPMTRGLLPGDCAGVIAKNGSKLGIVGLNSSWLQLTDADHMDRLHMDSRQLLSVTAEDPDKWCRANTFNLLVTHHPPAWLHSDSLSTWNSEIDPPGRFHAHLFGHMHEPDATLTSHGGAEPRLSMQSASLFGLEAYGKNCQRTHGYSATRISISENAIALRTWPRIAQKRTDGAIWLVPNMAFELGEDQSFVQTRPIRGGVIPLPAEADDLIATSTELSVSSSVSLGHILRKTDHHLPPANPHLSVREIERQVCALALQRERCAWLVADWGMGQNGFIWALQQTSQDAFKTYRLDLHEYVDRASFLDRAAGQIGCSFEQYCDLLSLEGASYLLLDDIPMSGVPQRDGALAKDIEQLVQIVLQYCPSVLVLMITRQRPGFHTASLIDLTPLDEADTRSYIQNHPLASEPLRDANISSQIYRHTDGVPARLDSALKELEVVSLSELLTTNSDATANDLPSDPAPQALVRSIAELAQNPDRVLQRTFLLLKTLSMFPQGEQLHHIKRFWGPHPLMPAHARELLERGLVDAIPLLEVGAPPTGDMAKTLVVRRPVRDYVRSLMKSEELSAINDRALELYFGSDWRNGTFKTPATLKFDDPHRGTAEISNASMVIVRLVRAAATHPVENRKLKEALSAALFYATALRTGGHYRGVIALGEDILGALVEEGFEAELEMLNFCYGECLRMVGERARAVKVLLSLSNSERVSKLRSSVLLSLALCYQGEGRSVDAVRVAREIIQLGPDSNQALQAESILLSAEGGDATKSLAALERRARDKKAYVVANNIALSRASELPSADLAGIRGLLEPVLTTAATFGDSYNLVRARLKIGRAIQASDGELGQLEKLWLIGAYQYLYNQRLDAMFDECHSLLWSVFNKADEEANLLRLFRHSSLIWRLRGRDHLETMFARKLAQRFAQRLTQDLRKANRETAYFLTRMHLALENQASESKRPE